MIFINKNVRKMGICIFSYFFIINYISFYFVYNKWNNYIVKKNNQNFYKMKKLEFILSTMMKEMIPNLFNKVLKNIDKKDNGFLQDICDGSEIGIAYNVLDGKEIVVVFEDELYDYIANNINDVRVIVGKRHKAFFELTKHLEEFYAKEEEYERCHLLKELRNNWKKL